MPQPWGCSLPPALQDMHAKHVLICLPIQDSSCSGTDANVSGTVNGVDSEGFSILGSDGSIEDDEEEATSQWA